MQKSADLQVLEVISPNEIVLDLNKNGVKDEDEKIFIADIQSFSTKPNYNQSELAKRLKISQEDALGLGFFVQNFTKSTLDGQKVKLIKNDIIVDNKSYKDLIIERGLAIENGKTPSKAFQQNLEKVRQLKLIIFNNKKS